MKVFLLIASLLITTSLASFGESPADSKVLHLTEDNITDFAYGGDLVVVLFFAPWCPHCMAFRPTYEKFAKQAPPNVTVADVDATVQTYLQDLFGVIGYPTVFVFVEGFYYEYPGARTVAGLNNFVAGGYAYTDGDNLPEVDSVAAFNFHKTQRLTQTLYTLLVGAFVLGVFGVISYFYCFNTGKSAAKEYMRLKMAKNGKNWMPIMSARETMASNDDAFIRPELA